MIPLTYEEERERNHLLVLQNDNRRWFTREEFERLEELSLRLFSNIGKPTENERNRNDRND